LARGRASLTHTYFGDFFGYSQFTGAHADGTGRHDENMSIRGQYSANLSRDIFYVSCIDSVAGGEAVRADFYDDSDGVGEVAHC
jgi:hypothetical protein